VRPPNLEELLNESEAAHALTVNTTTWNALLGHLLAHNVNNYIESGGVLRLCEQATPPSENRQRDGESIMGHLTKLYIERYGPLKYAPVLGKTYFEWEPLVTILTELRGDL
jgi:hypothetical protein